MAIMERLSYINSITL